MRTYCVAILGDSDQDKYREHYPDSSIFLFVWRIRSTLANRKNKNTHMRVIEQRIHPPRKRLRPLVQIVVRRSLRQMPIVFVLDVLRMRSVFGFKVVDPCGARRNYVQ
jgi:hypothetical protein